MMVPDLNILAMTGLLTLAAAGGGPAVQCSVPKPPVIKITPISQEIKYDFTLSAEELTQKKTATINPYQAGADSTTGGLRHDQPEMKVAVQWGYREYPDGAVCLWYDGVEVTITLRPTIYAAKDFDKQECRAAILEHERRHVTIDRQVINKYANDIGRAVQEAVNRAGALGPYKKDDMDYMQQQLVSHVENAIKTQELLLNNEMQARQGQVDTLAEYERVSKICHDAGVRFGQESR